MGLIASKKFNDLQPLELVYRIQIGKPNEIIPMLVKECVKDSTLYRLILFKDGIMSTDKIKEALNDENYIKGTLPELHYIVGRASSFMYKDKTRMMVIFTELQDAKKFLTS